jgi:hypothetical protein
MRAQFECGFLFLKSKITYIFTAEVLRLPKLELISILTISVKISRLETSPAGPASAMRSLQADEEL